MVSGNFFLRDAVDIRIPEWQDLWVIDQVWGQDGWILAKFFFCVFMDWDEVEVHKLAKKRTRPISSHLDWTNLVNKGFIIWLLVKFCLRDAAGSPERARWLHLARSGSQSQRAISFILPARGASHIIKMINWLTDWPIDWLWAFNCLFEWSDCNVGLSLSFLSVKNRCRFVVERHGSGGLRFQPTLFLKHQSKSSSNSKIKYTGMEMDTWAMDLITSFRSADHLDT